MAPIYVSGTERCRRELIAPSTAGVVDVVLGKALRRALAPHISMTAVMMLFVVSWHGPRLSLSNEELLFIAFLQPSPSNIWICANVAKYMKAMETPMQSTAL